MYVPMQDARRIVQAGMTPALADKHQDRASQQVLAAVEQYTDLAAPCTEPPAILTFDGTWAGLDFEVDFESEVGRCQEGTCTPCKDMQSLIASMQRGSCAQQHSQTC